MRVEETPSTHSTPKHRTTGLKPCGLERSLNTLTRVDMRKRENRIKGKRPLGPTRGNLLATKKELYCRKSYSNYAQSFSRDHEKG
jgi:hypothetical protein